MRAEAHRETRPSLILAALNQALLDWVTDDPRFLTAIYAAVRRTLAGASVQISAAAIQQSVRAFSGPDISDAVALVLKVPGRRDNARDSVPPGR